MIVLMLMSKREPARPKMEALFSKHNPFDQKLSNENKPFRVTCEVISQKGEIQMKTPCLFVINQQPRKSERTTNKSFQNMGSHLVPLC